MMVLKTSKWYQTVCLVMTRRMSIGTQHDLPRSNFHVDLSRTLLTMLFVMTSGDLNIDLTQKSFFYKSCSAFNELSNAVCRLSLRLVFFFRSEGEPKRFPRPISRLSEPARNRA